VTDLYVSVGEAVGVDGKVKVKYLASRCDRQHLFLASKTTREKRLGKREEKS